MEQRIINATKHESTNATPAELLFGRAINLDRGILFKVDDHKTSKNLSQWAHQPVLRVSCSFFLLAAACFFRWFLQQAFTWLHEAKVPVRLVFEAVSG